MVRPPEVAKMRHVALIAGFALAGLALPAQNVPPPKTHLKVGDPAPDFTLRTTLDTQFKLSEHRGKTVVLAFFPAAFTGG
jgi:peroxiredoxin Q/BCP